MNKTTASTNRVRMNGDNGPDSSSNSESLRCLRISTDLFHEAPIVDDRRSDNAVPSGSECINRRQWDDVLSLITKSLEPFRGLLLNQMQGTITNHNE
jgi:hypothetical protein